MSKLIIDPSDADFQALKRQYQEKQQKHNPNLYDQVKEAVLINSGDPNERLERITTETLRNIPIPKSTAPPVIIRKHKKHASGSRKKYGKKLHCFYCGQARLMRIATTVLELDGSIRLIYLKMRKTLQMLREDKHVKMPEVLIGNCQVCFENTFFTVTPSRKLKVSQEIEAQITKNIVEELEKMKDLSTAVE